MAGSGCLSSAASAACLHGASCGGPVCLLASAQRSVLPLLTPSRFCGDVCVAEVAPSPVTVAVCAHVSGCRHPLELSPQPKRPQHCSPTSRSSLQHPGQPGRLCGAFPVRSGFPSSPAMAAVWVASEPAVSRRQDQSRSFLSQCREPLTRWTCFWADDCQASAGVPLGHWRGGPGWVQLSRRAFVRHPAVTCPSSRGCDSVSSWV